MIPSEENVFSSIMVTVTDQPVNMHTSAPRAVKVMLRIHCPSIPKGMNYNWSGAFAQRSVPGQSQFLAPCKNTFTKGTNSFRDKRGGFRGAWRSNKMLPNRIKY
ncbi:hypothetical protein ACF0H5_010558 [Mactra antiquata]